MSTKKKGLKVLMIAFITIASFITGKIVDIRIMKDVVIAIPDLSDQVFDQVMEKQSLLIDSMSGATVSAKAYLKSLEMALDIE
ncbi:MAG: FMN-binding protein [Bacillota bacterium]|nr:FMN-binding protein [Bacillota bacterium]